MSHPATGATVTSSTIAVHAPRMGAPRTCAPAASPLHVKHDRKARDLG
jgi:hypothetical protein